RPGGGRVVLRLDRAQVFDDFLGCAAGRRREPLVAQPGRNERAVPIRHRRWNQPATSAGLMLAFRQNRLSGSYFALIAASLAKLPAYACDTRSSPSSSPSSLT